MFKRTTASVMSCTLIAAVRVAGGSAYGATKPFEVAGPHIPRTGGLVNIAAYSNNDGPKSSVILTEVIGDYGEAVRKTVSGTTNREYNPLDVSVTRGSFVSRLE